MLKKNDELELIIEDIGVNGEGIGHLDKMTFFVNGAVIGDTLKIGITKIKKNMAFGRIISIIKPSIFRVKEKCIIARQCGGCQLQEYSYNKQIEWKEKKVREDLIRIGGFSEEYIDKVMKPIIDTSNPIRYRNKAQFPVGIEKGEIVTGFYAPHSHRIVRVDDCILLDPINKKITNVVKSYMKKYQVSPYNEETGKGIVRHILTRYGFSTKELMVSLIINKDNIPHEKEFIETLTKNIKNITSICININKKRNNVILGDKTKVLYGKEKIEDKIGDIRFLISCESFFQVNIYQTKKLYDKALSYASLTGKEIVWDLYCGIGTISLFLAKKAKKVYGVEIVEKAILDARENAKLNGIDNAIFFAGKAEEILPKFYEEHKGEISVNPDVIVVDPPRKGLFNSLIDTIIKMNPKRIVYVSCNPSTLARDLKVFCEKSYELKEVTPVDQFPETVHVETIALLSKLNVDKHINVEIELDELDLTSAESKATYAQIKEYVWNKFELKVPALYIAQIKKKCGIKLREHYNKSKKEKQVIPQCTPEKEEAIMDALRHFKMI